MKKTQLGLSDRNIFLMILAVALLTASALWLVQPTGAPKANLAPNRHASMLIYPTPKQLAPFHLVFAGGEKFSADSLIGKWSVLFFGFTNCPDICPTTLSDMESLRRKFSTRDQFPPMQWIFVSVDPERDTAEKLRAYVDFFSKDIRAATGSIEALTRFSSNLGAVFAKDISTQSPDGYSIQHSGTLFLTDPQGRLVAMIRPPFDWAKIATDLPLYLEEAH